MPKDEPLYCVWREDEDGNWQTDCDEAFCFAEAGPAENGMRFCCYCGKPLSPECYAEEDADDEAD